MLWNYLKLSDVISKSSSKEDAMEIIEIMRKSSIMTWQHVNLYGEYNFKKLFSEGEYRFFEFDKIRDFKIEGISA
ncbi:Tn3 family transposase [Muricauda sp. SCSIO 64092]|uniref:Tn3 family transposase n=1 Tax=Allomuricauda sp. SCSIO 64092 TaxID=2908842 RepID=UPI001FF56FF6|nr:Tn3 family transposase [Muricauda sp. SCSIO 64092]UOY06551.1 Tn3 family transposase [Muricauda sp. SCSIO 64092]